MTHDPLQDMTQARWDALSRTERAALRDLSGLSPQLVGLEGWRVEVEDDCGAVRRFNVSRSTGWRPCHIELKRFDSRGGVGADKQYRRVTPLRLVEG